MTGSPDHLVMIAGLAVANAEALRDGRLTAADSLHDAKELLCHEALFEPGDLAIVTRLLAVAISQWAAVHPMRESVRYRAWRQAVMAIAEVVREETKFAVGAVTA